MVVQAVANIFLARLFGAQSFGLYAIAFSVASTASIVLGAGAVDALTPAATRAWHNEDYREMTGIAAYLLKFSFVAGLVALVVFLFLPFITGHIYHDRTIGHFAGSILLASLVSSLGISIVNLGLQLSGRYMRLSALTLADMCVRFAFSIMLVHFGWGVGGATVGQFMGALLIFLIVLVVWRDLHRASPVWPSLRTTYTSLWVIPLRSRLAPTLWVLGDKNLAMLFGSLPIAIAGSYLAAADVSYIKVALGYVTLALSVIGPVSVLLNVEFPKRMIEDNVGVRRMFLKSTAAGLLLTTSIMIGISLLASQVITALYGAEFIFSIPIVYSLFLYGATLGAGVALGPMWRALHRVRVSIFINAVTLLLGFPIGILLVQKYGGIGVSAMMTLWFLASQSVSFFWILKHLRTGESSKNDIP